MTVHRSKSIFHILLFFAILVSLLGGTVFVTPAYAASIVVDNNADDTLANLAGNGFCDLREAIESANTDTAVDACASGAAGADTITFAPGLFGQTINLASTLTLSSDMTIDGSGLTSQITISGDTAPTDGTGDVEVFSIGSSATVTLDSLTISKGSSTAGGGIYNQGTLTITNSTLSGNTASGPGGGIKNDGMLTVTNSTFYGNTATASGGGIRNIGALTVTNSTFSGNSAVGSGGGIYNVTGFTSVTITNSTFSGNAAGSAGGGIYYSGGVLNYANTIIANSTSGGDCAGDGTIGTNINNLVEDNTCSPSLHVDPGLGSLANNGGPTQTFALPDGSFAIDAGDNTTCNTVLVNSLDQRGISRPQGTKCDIGAYETEFFTVTTNADPGDGTCDASCSLRDAIAGAGSGSIINFYTALSGTTIHLASTLTLSKNVTIDGSALAGQITISGDTNSDNTGDVEVFSVNSGVTATLDSLAITKGSNFSGGGIRNDGMLTITNSTLSANSAISGGGSIFNTGSGTLTITNSTISGNSADSGGGIHNQGTLTVTNSTISGNSASGSSGGGGIYNNGGTLNYANTILANSTAGADCLNGGTGTIGTNINNLVEDGSSCSTNGTNLLGVDPILGPLADNGGPSQTLALLTGSPAINIGDVATCAASPVNNLDQRGVTRPQNGQCDIGAYEYETIVTSNGDHGAGTLRQAISAASAGDTIIFDSSVSDQTIYLDSTLNISQSMTIDGSALASKITVNGQGAVRVFFIHSGMTVTLDSLIITNGNGTDPSDEGFTGGGGIQNNTGNIVGNALTVKNSIISGNFADNGGGIFNKDGSTLTIINSTISGNSATGSGGGIYSDGNLLAITNSTISGNSSSVIASTDSEGGGGVRNGNLMTLTNSTISGNSADNGYGGGILSNGTLVSINSTISGNSASAGHGGGVYVNNALDYTNTIIANSASGGDCVGGDVHTNINNLVEDVIDSCSASLHGDPMLDVLVDNGGPTQTLALGVGSPAIDVGNDAACTSSPVDGLDQRGVARPVGACDIGAYEGAKDFSAPTVTTFTPTSPSSSLSIPIPASHFTASDNVGVTGYMITETSTAPSASASGWTASAPTTYTVVSDGMYTLYPWAKDAAGNVSAPVGSPASVSVDSTAPTVVSSVRVSASPSKLTSVQFTVTFSEAVTGVDNSDFSLTKTGVTGGAVTSVSGSGATRTVTVNTGSGNGTIRLNVLDDNSIHDLAGGPLNGAFSSGQTYTIDKTVTLTLRSNGTQDGWILESSETSAKGGTFNSTATTFRLGDDAAKKQYLGILSFGTGALPDTAVITGVTLKVKKQSITGGGNPLATFQGFKVDIKKGIFSSAALQAADFQTLASHTYGPFSPSLVGSFYSIGLTSGKADINKLSSNSGLTQIRLRFKLDDNNNALANYLSLYSGNATTVADRPQLVISYYVP